MHYTLKRPNQNTSSRSTIPRIGPRNAGNKSASILSCTGPKMFEQKLASTLSFGNIKENLLPRQSEHRASQASTSQVRVLRFKEPYQGMPSRSIITEIKPRNACKKNSEHPVLRRTDNTKINLRAPCPSATSKKTCVPRQSEHRASQSAVIRSVHYISKGPYVPRQALLEVHSRSKTAKRPQKVGEHPVLCRTEKA